MATIEQQDDILKKLATVGQAGASFKPQDPEMSRVVDEIQRRLSVIAESQEALWDHVRRGPIWGGIPSGSSPREFVAEASLSGADFTVTFNHGAGYVLNRWLITRVEHPGFGLTIPLPPLYGVLRIVAEDEMSTTFQFGTFDKNNFNAKFWILMWRDGLIPVDAGSGR